MNYIEFATHNKDIAVLLHGGGLAPQLMTGAAEALGKHYRVVLPAIPGHLGSGESYSSLQQCARLLLQLIRQQFGGRVKLLCGVSLGAQIAAEAAAMDPLAAECLVLESGSFIPQRLTAALAGPTFKASYPLIANRRFAKLQSRYLGIPGELFEQYYAATCAVSPGDLAAFTADSALGGLPKELQATKSRVLCIYSSGDPGVIRRSAKLIKELIPNAAVMEIPGLGHGQFSLCKGEEFAKLVTDFADSL